MRIEIYFYFTELDTVVSSIAGYVSLQLIFVKTFLFDKFWNGLDKKSNTIQSQMNESSVHEHVKWKVEAILRICKES